MNRRLTALAIAAATLVAGTAVGAATETATAGPGEDTVKVTIRLDGCGSCWVGLVHYDDTDADTYWSPGQKRAQRGRAVFDVPVGKAQGLSISIDATWATAYVHGAQYVVTQYGGFEPGDRVSRHQALHAEEGSRCWVGTDRDRTIHVKVAKKRYGSAPEVGLVAWASPTLASTNLGDVHDGTIVTTHPHCPAS
ncbi:hypothetical protein [Nocardioides sp. SR21]|uniref:hypothetical protein n=1 Tax=Nocardioides sp. SR21 TaxID=2919501 RepID=UPI001FA9542C|nr:hypothetical protein [Nocardioides sp. SR21]